MKGYVEVTAASDENRSFLPTEKHPPILGRDFIEALCDMYGVESDKVVGVEIDAPWFDILTVKLVIYGDERLVDMIKLLKDRESE